MFGKLFGVPQSIHESVVQEVLQSQRIVIADLVSKIEALTAENADLKGTIQQAFADLRELSARSVQPGPRPAETKPPDPGVRPPKPAYANSSISGRHHLRRPTPPPKEEIA